MRERCAGDQVQRRRDEPTMRVPKVIASRVARIAESTGAQRLVAQAHGTLCGAAASSRASAKGVRRYDPRVSGTNRTGSV